ncbi:hypothetical protein FA95DRAFT_1565191 [Auriscalpium vulgare]|uniref:Uncharacterized protein n=1 Tax=Auriscalpium vulgare TaxID=40419 RepID=A0ACB8RCF6_9AGAM|nr:hypothetical protein FA95DRAFT_1565191 [Auriscalpium vulgare]
MPFNSTGTAFDALPPSSRTCADIDSCRTLSNIVLSCLGTTFACVWTPVHRNITRPSRDMRSRLLNVVDMAKVVGVTLLGPEWVLAWAVRQFMGARHLAGLLEVNRPHAQRAWLKKRQLASWPGDPKGSPSGDCNREVPVTVSDDSIRSDVASVELAGEFKVALMRSFLR